MIRRIIRGVTIVFAAVVVALAIALGLFYYSIRPPSAERIAERFSADRVSYERLRGMIEADPALDRLAAWGVEIARSPPVRRLPAGDLSADRYNEYMSLLKKIGADEIGRSDPQSLDFYVGIWASGWTGDTVHISVRWLSQKPDHQVEGADDFDKTSIQHKGDLVYMHIDGNWYLVKDW
jgi:hypothetical protein